MAEFTYRCEQGHTASHADLFCSICGLRVAPVRASGSRAQSAANAAGAGGTSRTIACPVGHTNTPSDLFCGACGLEITPANETSRPQVTMIHDTTSTAPQPKLRARHRRVLSPHTTRRILILLVCLAVPLSAWAAVWAGSTWKKTRASGTSSSLQSDRSGTQLPTTPTTFNVIPTTTLPPSTTPQSTALVPAPMACSQSAISQTLANGLWTDVPPEVASNLVVEELATMFTSDGTWARVATVNKPSSPGYQPPYGWFQCVSGSWAYYKVGYGYEWRCSAAPERFKAALRELLNSNC